MELCREIFDLGVRTSRRRVICAGRFDGLVSPLGLRVAGHPVARTCSKGTCIRAKCIGRCRALLLCAAFCDGDFAVMVSPSWLGVRREERR
jgi:hypothetical protein